jgi:hypothetical protein
MVFSFSSDCDSSNPVMTGVTAPERGERPKRYGRARPNPSRLLRPVLDCPTGNAPEPSDYVRGLDYRIGSCQPTRNQAVPISDAGTRRFLPPVAPWPLWPGGTGPLQSCEKTRPRLQPTPRSISLNALAGGALPEVDPDSLAAGVRFDPWKGPLGVIAAYRQVRDQIPGCSS